MSSQREYLIFRAETLLDLAEVLRGTGRQGEARSRVEGLRALQGESRDRAGSEG